MGNASSTAAPKQHPLHHTSPTSSKSARAHSPASHRTEKLPPPHVPPAASSRIADAKRSKRSLEFPDFQIQPLTSQRRVSSFVPSEPIPIPSTAKGQSPYVRPVDPDSASMQDLVVPQAAPHPSRMPAQPLSPVQSTQELHQSSETRGPRSKAREFPLHEVVKSSVPLGLTTPEVTLGASQGANSIEVPTLVTWSGRGKDVWVEDTWNGRTRLTYNPEREIFAESVLLPVGNMSLKFIVDDELKLSPDLPMASDEDGALVNYITVSAPVPVGSEPQTAARDYHPPMWSASRWLKEPSDSYSNATDGAVSGSPPWTSDVPPHLVVAQAEEEAYNAHRTLPADARRVAPAPPVPIHPPAPTLPRHLDKVILSTARPRATTPKATTGRRASKAARNRERAAAEGDDDAVLPVPSHVVLHHLGTSAIRDGVIAVADTVRYRKKFITTVYYKPMTPAAPDSPSAAAAST